MSHPAAPGGKPVKPVFRVEVNASACKGCGLCIAFCPAGCLAISARTNCKGLHYVEFRGRNCSGCRACAIFCPDTALRIVRESCAAAKPARPTGAGINNRNAGSKRLRPGKHGKGTRA